MDRRDKKAPTGKRNESDEGALARRIEAAELEHRARYDAIQRAIRGSASDAISPDQEKETADRAKERAKMAG